MNDVKRPYLLLIASAVIASVVATVAPAQAAPATFDFPLAASNGARTVSTDPEAYARADKSADWVKTPNGLVHRDCVTELPEGATFDAGTVILADGTRQQVKPCRYATLARPPAASASSTGSASTGSASAGSASAGSAQVPDTDGWLKASWWNSPNWLSRIYAEYSVPTGPTKAGAINFFFSSFQPSDAAAIVQPVLTWGKNGNVGGNYWYINSWYVWGNNSVIGNTVQVLVGETIWGAMEAQSCNSDGSHCHWAIITRDVNTGAQSRIDIVSDSVFTTAQGGVFESYQASGCAMLPAGHQISFTNIEVWTGSGFTRRTPSFSIITPDQECSMTASATATSTVIKWQG